VLTESGNHSTVLVIVISAFCGPISGPEALSGTEMSGDAECELLAKHLPGNEQRLDQLGQVG
jgi:hypothetical protein